ncbi:MAG TPA: ABC transporter permease [Microbacterium sp.]|nr:ABC transporter permease [Microbacterium sp.]
MTGRMRALLPPWRRRGKSAVDEEADRHPLARRIARRDRFTFQDLVVEAIAGIGGRPARLVMTTLGTVLGIAALVMTIGFAQTAARQIASQFDAVAATQVVISPGDTRTATGQSVATARLPWDAPERVDRLAGVEAAGLIGEVALGDLTITAVPVNDPSAASTAPPPLIAASGGLLDAVRGAVVTGRSFDAGHDHRGDRVAVLGARAAERLGIVRIDRQPSIFIGGIAYAVIGVVDDMQRRPDLKDAVIVPMGAARTDFDLAAAEELQVRIAPGAGPQIARQAPIALEPNAPENFDVVAPSSRSDLSADVQADVNVVFLVLGAIALLAGGLGIANVTSLSVMERVGEIGLRRALGARRRQIAAQFMLESVIIGLLGGLIGSSLGVLAVVVLSLSQQWTPVLDPLMAIGAALLGAVVGLAAGGLPARRAARIEPITALRGS